MNSKLIYNESKEQQQQQLINKLLDYEKKEEINGKSGEKVEKKFCRIFPVTTTMEKLLIASLPLCCFVVVYV